MKPAGSVGRFIVVELADVETASAEVQAFFSDLQRRNRSRFPVHECQQAAECDGAPTVQSISYDDEWQLHVIRNDILSLLDTFHKSFTHLLRQIRLTKAHSSSRIPRQAIPFAADLFNLLSKVKTALRAEIGHSAAFTDNARAAHLWPLQAQALGKDSTPAFVVDTANMERHSPSTVLDTRLQVSSTEKHAVHSVTPILPVVDDGGPDLPQGQCLSLPTTEGRLTASTTVEMQASIETGKISHLPKPKATKKRFLANDDPKNDFHHPQPQQIIGSSTWPTNDLGTAATRIITISGATGPVHATHQPSSSSESFTADSERTDGPIQEVFSHHAQWRRPISAEDSSRSVNLPTGPTAVSVFRHHVLDSGDASQEPLKIQQHQQEILKRSADGDSDQQMEKRRKRGLCPSDLAAELLSESATSRFESYVRAYSRTFGPGSEGQKIAEHFSVVRSDDSKEARLAEVAQYFLVGQHLGVDSDFYRMLSLVALIKSVQKLDEAARTLGYQSLPKDWVTQLHKCLGSNIKITTLRNKLSRARNWIKMLGEFHGIAASVGQIVSIEVNEMEAEEVHFWLQSKKEMARQMHEKGKAFVECIVAGREYPTHMPGPQLQPAMPQTIPDTAPAIRYAMEGNITGLKSLFDQKLASPYDVSRSRNFSLIRWALYGGMHQYATVQFLMNNGAVVDEESYNHVWDFSFRGKCGDTEYFALGAIRRERKWDWIDEQEFPSIHKVVLRMEQQHSLNAELKENPTAVHTKDAQGRTALDWATARAQLDDMRMLIGHGSDVNTIDASGRSTVLHAVDSHNHAALQMILEAGGNVNPAVPTGPGRSSPLTSATFGGLSSMVSLLLRFGAKIDACNPEGRTPLATSIIQNKHDILKLFVKECEKYEKLEDPKLLLTIAEQADEKTLSILAASRPFLKVLPLGCDEVSESRRIMDQRTHNEMLVSTFYGLLTAAFSGRRPTPDQSGRLYGR